MPTHTQRESMDSLKQNNAFENVFDMIKASMWETILTETDEKTYSEFKQHGIIAIPAHILPSVAMTEQLRQTWKQDILKTVFYYNHYINEIKSIPITVPYTILKGTAAAQYYPYPEFRTMGDIDIMTKREDFEIAYQELVDNGYEVVKTLNREITFKKDVIEIELHRFFASLNNPKHSQYLDDIIIESITPSHILPDMINGLVILEHISQHMEHGLGLRQIIDWMMFVDRCLTDDKWPEFSALSDKIGMTRFAVIVTRMCELYLGLTERCWSKDADGLICERLMDYVMNCGNFGSKWTSDSDVGQMLFTYARGPVSTFKLLQERGLVNWNATQKYAFLRPFAWIYQAIRYIHRGLRQEGEKAAILDEYKVARERNALFDTLGIKQKAKGIVTYRNGKYVKK